MKDDDRWHFSDFDPGGPEHAFDFISDQHGASMDKGPLSSPQENRGRSFFQCCAPRVPRLPRQLWMRLEKK